MQEAYRPTVETMVPHTAETADSGSCVRPHASVGFDLCIVFNSAVTWNSLQQTYKMDSDRDIHARSNILPDVNCKTKGIYFGNTFVFIL
jgi:hypothetical protein